MILKMVSECKQKKLITFLDDIGQLHLISNLHLLYIYKKQQQQQQYIESLDTHRNVCTSFNNKFHLGLLSGELI